MIGLRAREEYGDPEADIVAADGETVAPPERVITDLAPHGCARYVAICGGHPERIQEGMRQPAAAGPLHGVQDHEALASERLTLGGLSGIHGRYFPDARR